MPEIKNYNQEACIEIGILEENGQVLTRDMRIQREGVSYGVHPAIPEFVSYTNNLNTTLPEDAKTPNYLPLKNISTKEETCQQLSQMSLADLAPYIEKI